MRYVSKILSGSKEVQSMMFSMHRGFPMNSCAVVSDLLSGESECFGTEMLRHGMNAYGVVFDEDTYRAFIYKLSEREAVFHEYVESCKSTRVEGTYNWGGMDACMVYDGKCVGYSGPKDGFRNDAMCIKFADEVYTPYDEKCSVCVREVEGKETLISMYSELVRLSRVIGVNLFQYREIQFLNGQECVLMTLKLKHDAEAQRYFMKTRLRERL